MHRASADFPDAALRIAVDRNGFAYATGLTKSRDFPVTSGGLLRGNSDAFLAKISSTGEVIYSATFGGSGDEIGNVAFGQSEPGGSVYLGGSSFFSRFSAWHPICPTSQPATMRLSAEFRAREVLPNASGLVEAKQKS